MQNNNSVIILETKGSLFTGKRVGHMSVWYYFIKNLGEKGQNGIEICKGQDMSCDFQTKPFQGKIFLKFKRRIPGF